jgi:divalent metal cation (Fe/Co/Zn/Cd) transporter
MGRVLAIALSEPLVREAHDITIFEHDEQASVSLHLKFPADTSLEEAHHVSERVEAAIRELPGISDGRTHLEPLEQPLAADPRASREDRQTLKVIEDVVREQTGTQARDVRMLPTPAGTVMFMTVQVGRGVSLTDAHRIASSLEETLRQRLPELADVVVHTEP